tara:strand:- start:401 stop:733 length:333 start_codon:yes stop_codon:yes gene_type:complete
MFAVVGFADVKLLDSFPKSDSKLGEMVTDLRLWFDVEPDPAGSKIELLKDDSRIPVLALHSMGENDLMGFVQQPTPPGRYRVVWQATAVGTDTVVYGEFDFIIVNSGPKP